MKAGWQVKRLGEVSEIKPPKREAKSMLKDEDLVSFVPMDVLGIDQKYFYPNQTRKLSAVAGSYTYFKNNDVLLAKITPCFENGKLGIAKNLENGVGFGSSEFIVYRPSQNELFSEFLYYFLSQPSFREEGKKRMSGAVGHKRIPKDFYEQLEIPIPPLPEQKQIVAKLDEVFAAIDKAKANIEKNIENAKELYQSKLNEVFSQKGEGWEFTSLGKLLFVKSGGTPLKSKKEFWVDGIIPWYSSGELNNVYTNRSNNFITEIGLNNSNAKLFPKGSLLIGMYDTAALKMSILDRNAAFNQAIAGVKPTEQINLLFIMYYINSIRNVLLNERRGVRQKNLSLKKICDIRIPLFKLQNQNKMVDVINNYQNKIIVLEKAYTAKLSALDELKKTVLQKAFRGEL